MKTVLSSLSRHSALGLLTTCTVTLTACLGGDGSSPSIASNPSLVNADSPSLTASTKSYSGRFRDAERNLDFSITFASETSPQGNDGVIFTGDDNVASYRVITPRSAGGRFLSIGDPEKEVLIVAPGVDGAWYTEDDVPQFYIVNTRKTTSDGIEAVRRVFYSDAGSDGEWFTDDDGITEYEQTENAVKDGGLDYVYILYSGSGADGAWFTTDDTVRFRRANVNGQSTLTVPGSDDIFGTEDDVLCDASTSVDFSHDTIVYESGTGGCTNYFEGPNAWYPSPVSPFRTVFSVTATTSDYIVYRDAGADGEWRTSDDVIDARFVSEELRGLTESSLSSVRVTYYDDPGLDGLWLTDDDHIARTSVSRDPQWMVSLNNNFLSSIKFNGAGADGAWFTMDDTVESAQREVGGLFGGWDRTDITYRDTGSDRMLGTGDDVVSNYKTKVCRTGGGDGVALVENFDFSGPGPDNAWLTSDDEVATYHAYYNNFDPNETTIADICSPLAEIGWAPQFM